MKARLRTVLDALGLDTTLADTATFSRDSADTISKTVSDIKKSAEQNGWDADSSVLNYLSDAAQLQLNIPESDWPGGLTITVSNDLRTSVVCNSSAEVKTFATLAEERVIAADLQEKYGSLFTSLLGGEYTDVTDGGDSTIYGQPSSLFVKFAADSFHYLLVSVDTDGNLLSLHETDRTVEPLGEYTSVSRAEADKRLANGEFLTDSYTAEAVDPAAEPEHLANLRLTYVRGAPPTTYPCGNTRLMRAPLPWAMAMMSTRRCTPFLPTMCARCGAGRNRRPKEQIKPAKPYRRPNRNTKMFRGTACGICVIAKLRVLRYSKGNTA